jgi:hypothetical protein
MQPSRFLSLMTRGFAAFALLFLFSSSPALRAQEPASNAPQDTHLVSPAQLQQQVQGRTATRQQDIDTLTRFLSTPTAEKAMKDARVDPVQVKTAIPSLSDAELANLSARAAHAQSDFAGGSLTTLALALIIIAVVLIILLAVYH